MRRARIRRPFGRDARWVRPPVAAVLVPSLALAAVVAGLVACYRWATASYDGARTIAAAGAVLRAPVRLEAALAVEWREAVASAGEPGTSERLLAPPLPPPICVASDVADAAPAPVIDDAVRGLDSAIRRGAAPAEVERRIAELRAAGPVEPGGREEFVLRYNLGRGYLAAGDPAGAAEIVEPVFDGYLSRDRLPVATAARAGALARGDAARDETAALGYHARFLAGAIAYRRAEVAEAIKHFRLAINAVNYLTPADSVGVLEQERYRRVAVEPPGACGAASEPRLTSLDAYAALVAAYMAAPEFTDPSRLPPEVRRTRLQIDPDDPFRPVLRFARTIAGRPSASPIPENLLWAASNLQRVYHHNRINPDARLTVTRAVLLLHLTAKREWVEAIAASGETDVCAMLVGIASGLERDASARALTRGPGAPSDSAAAAAAIHTFARLDRECGPDPQRALGSDVRSAWLRHGRAYLGSGLPGLYEEWRLALEAALRPSGAPERAVAAAVAPVLARVDAHVGAFGGGRVPAELPATIAPARAARFVAAWRRAVFEDVANALADAGSAAAAPQVRAVAVAGAGIGGVVVQIPAGHTRHFLASLNSAVAHAGLRPSQVYAPGELARLARAGGRGDMLAYRVRYHARSRPGATLATLAALSLCAATLLYWVHVTWWRYRLLTRDRLYAAERARRNGVAES